MLILIEYISRRLVLRGRNKLNLAQIIKPIYEILPGTNIKTRAACAFAGCFFNAGRLRARSVK